MHRPSYGVIVGRFQVHQLHDGHIELLRAVLQRHQRVLVFVGVRPTEITRSNPLDFETRKQMLVGQFPTLTVLPITDTESDDVWSHVLDRKILEVADYGDVTLYGGRDSFVPHYHGRFTPVELALSTGLSGTQVREALTDNIIDSPDFRAGIIHAAYNMRPRTFATVDVVIARHTDDGVRVLLGQKAGSGHWRFIGGFAEPTSKSYEADAQRESYEETGLTVDSLEYLGSTLVSDWRYASDPDCIKTLVFLGWTSTAGAKAADDIEHVEWFKPEWVFNTAVIDPVHHPILLLLERHRALLT